MERITMGQIWRYKFHSSGFEPLGDAGMAVSRMAQVPLETLKITDLKAEHHASQLHLRPLPRLTGLRDLWQGSLHVSGIRLRNAHGW